MNKPCPDCPYCYGTGTVYDSVPYGSTNVPMDTECECVEYECAHRQNGTLDFIRQSMDGYKIYECFVCGEEVKFTCVQFER